MGDWAFISKHLSIVNNSTLLPLNRHVFIPPIFIPSKTHTGNHSNPTKLQANNNINQTQPDTKAKTTDPSETSDHKEQARNTDMEQNAKSIKPWRISRETSSKKNQTKGNRKLLYIENRPRGEKRENQPGYKTLTIESISPDNLIADEGKTKLTRELQKRKIHIAGIQETHIPLGIEFARNGYSVITSSATHTQRNLNRETTTAKGHEPRRRRNANT